MSNPVFYAADLASVVFTMSLTENASFPLANLSTYLPLDLWKSSAATNAQTLKIDLGSAKACDFLALGSYNWSGMTTVSLQVDNADNPAFTSPVDVLPAANPFASAPVVSTFSSLTKRYWRILFTNTNSIVPQAGLLLLGSQLALTQTYDWDFNIGDKEFTTNKRASIEGTIRTVRLGGGRGKHTFKISLTNDAFRTSWQALCAKTYGSANPFFWADHAATIRISHFEADYMPIAGHRYDITDLVPITLLDQSLS